LWGLDLPLVDAVSRHHQPGVASAEGVSLARLVFDANREVHAAETASPPS
jgi:hypothetical protein